MVKVGSRAKPRPTPVPRKKTEKLTKTEMILHTSIFDAYKKQYKTKSTLRYETTVALEEKLIRMKVLNPNKFIPKIHDLGFIGDVSIVGVEQPDGSFTQMTKKEWEKAKKETK